MEDGGRRMEDAARAGPVEKLDPVVVRFYIYTRPSIGNNLSLLPTLLCPYGLWMGPDRTFSFIQGQNADRVRSDLLG